MEEKCIKAINFDLSENLLKLIFSETTYRNAWIKLGSCFNQRGWTHRQYSGYVSLDKLLSNDVYDLLDFLVSSIPNIMSCVKDFDVTDVRDDMFGLVRLINDKLESIKESKSPDTNTFILK